MSHCLSRGRVHVTRHESGEGGGRGGNDGGSNEDLLVISALSAAAHLQAVLGVRETTGKARWHRRAVARQTRLSGCGERVSAVKNAVQAVLVPLASGALDGMSFALVVSRALGGPLHTHTHTVNHVLQTSNCRTSIVLRGEHSRATGGGGAP